MPSTRIPVPNLYGGVSQQPPAVRLPNQVEAASNVALSVRNGATKRPGTRFIATIPGLASGAGARFHPLDRDSVERYLVLATAGSIRVFTDAGVEQIVYANSITAAYLAAGGALPSDYRFTSSDDMTVIANTKVALGTKSSPAYAVTGAADDFTALQNQTPDLNTYWRTNELASGVTKGFWKYTPGLATYATHQGPGTSTFWGTPSNYANSLYVGGFKVGIYRWTCAIWGTWQVAAMLFNQAGAFADYVWQPGDQINITAGAGLTPGWYEILEKLSVDALILKTSPGPDCNSVTAGGIGRNFEIAVDLQRAGLVTMHDVAMEFTKAFQACGATNGCIGWTYRYPNTGHFTITSPFLGSGTSFAPSCCSAPTTGYDYSLGPFLNAGSTNVDGTGDPATPVLAPAKRWTRVPAAAQASAMVDEATMPVRLTSAHVVAGVYVGGYQQLSLDLSPVVCYRLGEAAGTLAIDGTGQHIGTYHGTPTLGVAGALSGDTNTSVTFVAATAGWMEAGTLGDFGSRVMPHGFSVSAWVKTAAGTVSAVVSTGDGYACPGLDIIINGTNPGHVSAGFIYASVSSTGEYVSVVTNAATAINNGSWHHLFVTFDTANPTLAQVIKVYLDGAIVATTTSTSGWTTGVWTDLLGPVGIGHRPSVPGGSSPIFCDATLDEVSIFHSILSPTLISALHSLALNPAFSVPGFWALRPIDWAFRETGDETTNKVPTLWSDAATLSDIVFHRSRLVFAGGESIFLTQVKVPDEDWSIYLHDSENMGASDPIDCILTCDQVVLVDSLTPFAKALVILTKAGRQFELSGDQTLSPTDTSITPSTAFPSLVGVKPAVLAAQMYFAAPMGGFGQLYEYYYDANRLANSANQVSAHVDQYLPLTIYSLRAAAAANCVLVLPSASSTFYVYRVWWSQTVYGDQKVQSAWSRYDFDTQDTIADVAILGSNAYLLLDNGGNRFHLVALELSEEATPAGMPFSPRLDKRVLVTGVYNGGTGHTTFTTGYTEGDTASMTGVVKGAGWGATAGTAIPVVSATGTTVVVAGDLSAFPCYVGKVYAAEIEFSRPYPKDQNGIAILDGRFIARQLVLNHHQTAAYDVTIDQLSRPSRIQSFTVAPGETADGKLNVYAQGEISALTVKVRNTGPYPFTVGAVEWIGDFDRRMS